MISFLQKYAESFLALLYPKLCLVCESSLLGNEDILCTPCRHSLPLTHFHLSEGNPVEQIFWGRLPVHRATSLLYFDKGSAYNRLIHHLKYQGRKDVGLFLGKLLGSAILSSSLSSIDYIVPVPLHRAKLHRRGFNQSQIIAEGVGEMLGVEVLTDILSRKVYTPTQTLRKRYDRWKNVEGIFECKHQDIINRKHILLIDDVITTGATMEAAGSVLYSAGDVLLSVAAVCYTNI
jgi:ComF family protein